jgi:cell division protein FtsI (penicillin-binding protein 3)
MRWASPGIALSREPDRLYPQTDLAAHVLGSTDIDGQGASGMERGMDAYLSDPASRGEPLTLSISSRVQQALEHELLQAKTSSTRSARPGVLLDIHTGEVLAMTSLPQLNPNIAGNMDRKRASTAPRWASSSWDRPSSRSPSPWRSTPAT